ncbi:MAG: CDP-alcohol phosphatidyltransferase family protein [Pseudomonadota bacterium]
MFDARIRPLIDPPLNRLGARLAAAGVTADAVTWAGFAIGMTGCLAIAFGAYGLALAFILVSRLADGLDGAVARATVKTDRGGFLDIVLDFIFYGAVPVAFAWADPAANALAAATLLLTYFANGSSFLAYAIMAEKRGAESNAQGEKNLFYLAGLAEGFETILVTCLWCLFPTAFAPLAYLYAALVAASAAARIAFAARTLD